MVGAYLSENAMMTGGMCVMGLGGTGMRGLTGNFNRFAEQNFDRQPGCDGLQTNCAMD
jgi:hypothetical protein